MYLGSHSINMDAKGRIAIPSKIRESLLVECGARLVLTAHTEERCLLVYPEPVWLELLPKIQRLPNLNKAARRMQRLLMGYATETKLDSSGRLLVPSPLRDYGNFEKRLMLVGQGNKMELWSEDSWANWLDEPEDGKVPPELLQLSL